VVAASGFDILPRGPGWPDKRNPVYTVILARQVRMRANTPIMKDPAQIYAVLIDRSFHVRNKPDLMVAGRSNILMPYVHLHDGTKTISSPFQAGTEMACFTVDGIAFGLGLCHMLWALDYIELGSMPWSSILSNGLGLPRT
jgi:hypothetical protein